MKKKYIVLFALLICYSTSFSQIFPFIHCATTGNIDNELTEIDNAQINDDPNAIVMVEKVRIDDNGTTINNPHFVGVRYNAVSGRWYVHNENPSDAMIENSYYLIYTPPATLGQAFQHLVESANIVSGLQNASRILNGLINDIALSRCKINRVHDSNAVQNNNPIEMYYNWENPGEWYAATLFGTNMPIGAAFNVMCNPSGFTVVEHMSLTENTGSEVNSVTDYAYWTVLDHPLLNNNPNAWFFVNHRREPATGFIFRSLSTYYDVATGRWRVYMELESYVSGFSFPIGRFFDLFIWDDTLGVDEFDSISNLKVYPNPSNSVFTVEAKQNISSVSIFNILGQELSEFKGNGNNVLQLNMGNYDAGHYVAKIRIGNNFETVKLIKN